MKNEANSDLSNLKYKIDDNLFEIKKLTGQYLDILSSEIDKGNININDNIYDASYWNDIGVMFLRNASFSDAEKVFNHMINFIKDKEKTLGELNKGLAYYQLGISKLVQKNYDEGVPHILDSIKEDIKKVGVDKSKSLYASKFNKEIMFNLGKIIDADYMPIIKTCINTFPNDSNNYLHKINESEKMFFYKILILPDYIEFSENIYTKNLLFNRLRELCLMFEHVLRKYPHSHGNLGDLISNAFSSKPWFRLYNSNSKKFDTIPEFQNKLNSYINAVINNENLFISTIISQTHLLRNYMSHYYDQYPTLLSNKSLYENCAHRIIYGILYSLYEL